MSKPAVTVIGLGNMGTALARTLVEAGHPTTVWNRTEAKSAPIGEIGATIAASPAEAIAASPVTIFSLLDYGTVHDVLGHPDITAAAGDKTLVNLTSGAPEEAHRLAEVVADLGARYLDGNIEVAPEVIGTSGSLICCSGEKAVFDHAQPCLVTFGENLRYRGSDYGAGNALFLAGTSVHAAELLGAFLGAAYVSRYGVDFATFVSETAFSPDVKGYLHEVDAHVRSGDYAATSASVGVWQDAMGALARDMVEAKGFDNPLFNAVLTILGDAVTEGHADDELAVMYKRFDDQASAKVAAS
jgi:3-hydroxyisobutyrate dehydrogenase-like beta-hydroxyacid dehydrogenase